MDDVEALVRQQRIKYGLANLIGGAPAFTRALATVQVAAQSSVAVLVCGETGTGKELVARAIHYLSDRATGPFVAVNCGSLTDTLLEDELFGHERGAFTDAQQRRVGLVAQAEQGTLFMDEIDTLSQRGQVALLRLLQDKAYRPLGSHREYRADVRFVAATNAPLETAMGTGAFRADLYYRLCVFTIVLPPLRERYEDILLLATHFLEKYCPSESQVPMLSESARAALMMFAWPGNVRELENAMIRAVRLCQTSVIEVEHLGLPVDPDESSRRVSTSNKFRMLKSQLIRDFERRYLTEMMQQANGNISRAARLAGKDRRDFGKLLKKHGLAGESFRKSG